jgi:hypothetical protein
MRPWCWAGGLAVVAALATPAPASAAVTCDAGAILQVIADATNDLALIERGTGTNIDVRTVTQSTPLTCTGGQATTTDVGAIQLTKPPAANNVTFIVEDAAGMAPGSIDEGDGSSEIEIFVNLAGGTGHELSLRVGRFPTRIVVGQDGANLNADEDPDDRDVTILGDPELDIRGGFSVPVNASAQGGEATGAARTDPIEFLGSTAPDVIVGGEGPDRIQTFDDADRLEGRGGGDLLQPGAGNDLVDGGSGIDTVDYFSFDLVRGVTVDLASAGPQPTGASGNDELIGVENVVGTQHDDDLRGDGGPNRLDGGAAGDRLEGRAGPDVLRGGPGNDRIEARDGERDEVDCGAGDDVAVVDEADIVTGCEIVLPLPEPPPQPAAPAEPVAAPSPSVVFVPVLGTIPAPRAVLRALRVAPRAFVPARSGPSARPVRRRSSAPGARAAQRRSPGAVVSFTSSQAAVVRYRVARRRAGRRVGRRCLAPTRRNRARRPCARFVELPGSFSRAATQGPNRFRFTGRLRSRALPVGRYQLRATPRGGATVRTEFRIVRARTRKR